MTTIGQLKSDEPIHGDAISITYGSGVGTVTPQSLASTSFVNVTGLSAAVSVTGFYHVLAVFDFSIDDSTVVNKLSLHFEGRITQDNVAAGASATYYTAPGYNSRATVATEVLTFVSGSATFRAQARTLKSDDTALASGDAKVNGTNSWLFYHQIT